MNNQSQPTIFHLVILLWEESERGWGTRPDGCSLHTTMELGKEYVKSYNASLPNQVPDSYSRPYSGSFHLLEVSAGLHALVHAQPNGSLRMPKDVGREEWKVFDIGPYVQRDLDQLNKKIREGRQAVRAKKRLLKKLGQFLPE